MRAQRFATLVGGFRLFLLFLDFFLDLLLDLLLDSSGIQNPPTLTPSPSSSAFSFFFFSFSVGCLTTPPLARASSICRAVFAM